MDYSHWHGRQASTLSPVLIRDEWVNLVVNVENSENYPSLDICTVLDIDTQEVKNDEHFLLDKC